MSVLKLGCGAAQLAVHMVEGVGAGGGPPPWRTLGAVRGRSAEQNLRLAAAGSAGDAFLLWRAGGALHRWQPGEGRLPHRLAA